MNPASKKRRGARRLDYIVNNTNDELEEHTTTQFNENTFTGKNETTLIALEITP